MKTFSELVRRYSEVQGVPFAELAELLACPLPPDPKRDKGYAGRLIEQIGGKAPDSSSAPDLDDFDIEVKTVPIGLDMVPREPTKITSLNPAALAEEEWFTSHVYRKARVLLFVPVVKADLEDVAAWYVRRPFIWLPPASDLLQLQRDWEDIKELVLTHGPDALSSKSSAPGVFLMTKTSHQGSGKDTKRYAFWFRQPYTAGIIRANIGYKALRAT
jgi:DNA mismatch repair protein MutH